MTNENFDDIGSVIYVGCSTTLVERLRDGADICHARNSSLDFAKVATEAADRIEALEARPMNLQKVIDGLNDKIAELEAIVQRQQSKDELPQALKDALRVEWRKPGGLLDGSFM
jgi:uncharacterized coiled-coil protein SlyX